MKSNPLADFVRKYGPQAGETGPERFVLEVLGVEKIDLWQERTLRAFARGERRISIRACPGPGKTALAAWLVLYMLLFRFPQKTVATAPTRPQLEGALVSEVFKWFGKLPDSLKSLYEPKANSIELIAAPHESYFEGRTARAETPEAFQGVHSDHVLLIADEASGIPEQIFKAGQGAMTKKEATTLLLSNPTRTSGYFYRSHNQNKDRWFTVHVAAKDSSRVGPEFIKEMADEWGEDSDEYRVRVLGEFPKQDLNTLIPVHLVEIARSLTPPTTLFLKENWGLDVARFGGDATALVRRNRLAVNPQIEQWHKKDLMYTVNRVHALWKDTPTDQRPDDILVDDIGMGGGVTDRLQELGLPARGINVQVTESVDDRYKSMGTQLWFKCKDWLETKLHGLPKLDCCGKPGIEACLHDKLAEELCIPRYGYTTGGRLHVESKDSMKKRGYKSPNLADALMLTFASEIATLLHGSGKDSDWNYSWSKPIHRQITHV